MKTHKSGPLFVSSHDGVTKRGITQAESRARVWRELEGRVLKAHAELEAKRPTKIEEA